MLGINGLTNLFMSTSLWSVFPPLPFPLFSFSPSSSPFFFHERIQREGKYSNAFTSYSQSPEHGENECVLVKRLGVPCFVIAA